MAEKTTANWDVYDWLDVYASQKRRCPKCGDHDVKYGVHNPTRGYSLSVVCNACRHSDKGQNSGADAERLVSDWHEAPPSKP